MPAPRGQEQPPYAPSGFPTAPSASNADMPAQRPTAPPLARSADHASQIQQSIARIHEACQAPPLSPPEYRVLFEVMAEEITANNLSGQQTLTNIGERARDMGQAVDPADRIRGHHGIAIRNNGLGGGDGHDGRLFFPDFVASSCTQQGKDSL